MSDQVGNQNVGFLITRLILIVSSVPVSTSNLPLPGLDPEKLLASGIETHRLESGCASRERRGEYERGLTVLSLVGGQGGLPLDFMSR